MERSNCQFQNEMVEVVILAGHSGHYWVTFHFAIHVCRDTFQIVMPFMPFDRMGRNLIVLDTKKGDNLSHIRSNYFHDDRRG